MSERSMAASATSARGVAWSALLAPASSAAKGSDMTDEALGLGARLLTLASSATGVPWLVLALLLLVLSWRVFKRVVVVLLEMALLLLVLVAATQLGWIRW